MSSPQISDLAASFKRYLRAAGKADRTVTLYLMSIRFFCDWLTEQGRPSTLDQMTRYTISAWLIDLHEVNEASTVVTRMRGLRRFARWLVTEGELDSAPTEGVEAPTPVDKPVPVLTEEEWLKLLKACAVPRVRAGFFIRRVFDGRRDEVILRLLLDCGLRVSELCGLSIEDVDLDRELAYVIGKGSRPRIVPFSPRTAQAIDRYMRQRALHPKASSPQLLLSERGAMSSDGVRWRLEVLGESAGIKGLHPHVLRHTFSHRWLANGGQERDLMNLAGWRSTAMLQVYARSTAVERAHEAHRRMRENDSV